MLCLLKEANWNMNEKCFWAADLSLTHFISLDRLGCGGVQIDDGKLHSDWAAADEKGKRWDK